MNAVRRHREAKDDRIVAVDDLYARRPERTLFTGIRRGAAGHPAVKASRGACAPPWPAADPAPHRPPSLS